MNKSQTRILHELANCYGVQTAYYDVFRARKTASNHSLFNVLKSLRVPVETEHDLANALHEFYQTNNQQKVQPVLVAWDGTLTAVPLRLTQQEAHHTIQCRLIYEDGAETSWDIDLSTLPVINSSTFDGSDYLLKTFAITHTLPCGYHRLLIQTRKNLFETLIVSAPLQAYRHPTQPIAKSFGLFTPIYALHSQHSIGCGDLTDFKKLISWTAQQRGKFVSTTPLHAAFLDEPCEFSPYSPVSRLFWNELFLDITAIPEFEGEILPDAVKALNASQWVEYQKIIALKRHVLERMCQKFSTTPGRREAFENYLKKHPEAKDYSAFRAACELHKQPWIKWSEAQRQGNLPTDIVNDKNYHYHLYVQWQIQEQLENVVKHAKAISTFLYLDTPLGVHPHGYDTWRFQQDFPQGATAGAPPDGGFPLGQNWGIAPLHPSSIRRSHYQYFIQCLKTIMPQHDLLRLDHVMSLHRLYWIPENCQPHEGVYVHYPAEELYAILSLESHHHQVGLIGENLGTVPSYVNQMMRAHHIDPMYVLQYELDSNHPITKKMSKNCIASLNTHDMPPFAAYLQGLDIQQRIEVGVLDPSAKKTELTQRQDRLKILMTTISSSATRSQNSIQEIVFNTLTFLAAEKAQYLLINLEDLWLETTPQNIPSLPADKSRNWQHKNRYAIEEFEKNRHITRLLSSIAEARTLTKVPKKTKTARTLPEAKPTVNHTVSLITADDLYLFNEGNHFRLYEKLGAHPIIYQGQAGVYFAVWAPNAQQVSVIGDFNGWNRHSHILKPRESSGIWEGFIPELKTGTVYKYFIRSHHLNYQVEKADPFGFYHEIPPKTASIVNALNYEWQDANWMQHRAQSLDKPMAVYELHLGSWRRLPEENNRFLTYREIAPYLAEYVNKMGYTHVEFMPLMEHPFYDSWGYQITGYFAPTSRYGTPEDFMYLVDYLHQHEIGVILDWVPSHFPYDQHGLAYFDGTSLFEHADPRQGFHPDWTSAIFNYGRNEVRAFLISSALFWLDKYHIDGLRVDAVASMLYLDYSRKAGQWLPNAYGGRENLDAIHFLQRLNQAIYQHYPAVQTIAEESTAWGGVSKPTYIGGLGFGLKWDMGWMHDTLNYLAHDAIHRSYHHNEMTFRMIYAFTENFMLPLSHDEVVHGKSSLLGKMPGTDWDKFANVRLLLGYMYAQSGKKIIFMGNDIGVWNEWNCNQSLDWHLLAYAPHQGLQKWVQKLNHLYKNEPALHSLDCDPKGFEWIDGSDKDHSVLSFLRKASDKDVILVILNATPMCWQNHRIGVPFRGKWLQIANSDDNEYGGSGNGKQEFIMTEDMPFHFRPFSLNLNLPPLGVVFFKFSQ